MPPERRRVGILITRLYEDVRRLASSCRRRESSDLTLETSDLVHEAYLRLANQQNVEAMDEVSFRAAVANVIRRVLVDHARAKLTKKRGQRPRQVSLDLLVHAAETRGTRLAELDEALSRLASLHEQTSRIVELRFFGGLTVDEVSEIMQLSRRTVERGWTFAKAWKRCYRRRERSVARKRARVPPIHVSTLSTSASFFFMMDATRRRNRF